METLKLNYPLPIDGGNVSEITYDYADFKGHDYLKALARRETDVGHAVNPVNDYALHFALGVGVILASNKDKGWTPEDFNRLSGSDLWQVTQVGLVFFGATPGEPTESNSGEPSGSMPNASTLPAQNS